MKVRLVVFKDGRRVEKRYEDHLEAADVAAKLKRKGIRVRLVTLKVLGKRRFPPAGDDLDSRTQGKMWCPFCGAWSYFKVPKFRNGVRGSILDEQVFLNSCYRQDIKVCSWCHISEFDFDVKMANDTWAEQGRRRRRRKRKVDSRKPRRTIRI